MVTSTPSVLKKSKAPLLFLLSLAFWVGVWALVARWVDAELILPSPSTVWRHFLSLLGERAFYRALSLSLWHITLGFLCGTLFGVLLALGMHVLAPCRALFSPLLLLVRATPIASFSLLAYFWLKTEQIPTLIAALMVLPIVCAGMQSGLGELDRSTREMLSLYRVPFWYRLRFFYLPSLLPYLSAACVTSFGLAWKAGVAAEILVVPEHSIGRHLYEAKMYLETADLFAYTLVVILCSLVCETGLRALLRRNPLRHNLTFPTIGGTPT